MLVTSTRIAPVLGLPVEFREQPPKTAAHITDEDVAGAPHLSDFCGRCGHWRKEHGNKGHGGDNDGCDHVADGPDGAPREGEACDCPAFAGRSVE